jgi:hypothetical protein
VYKATAYTGALETPDLVNTTGWVAADYVNIKISPGSTLKVEGDVADQLLAQAGDPDGLVNVYAVPFELDSPQWVSIYEEDFSFSTENGYITFWADPANPGPLQMTPQDINSWLVAVPGMMTTTRVQTEQGVWLYRGIDFQSGPGVVLFYEDPSVLFPKQHCTVCGMSPTQGFYNYTLSVDNVRGSGPWVWHYYRNAQSLVAFRRALAEASGLHVWPADTHIVRTHQMPVGATYYTPRGRVDAWYPHTVIPAGRLVYRGDIVVDPDMFSVVETNGEIIVTLSEPLFVGAFLRRAVEFAEREKPLGVNTTITIEEVT